MIGEKTKIYNKAYRSGLNTRHIIKGDGNWVIKKPYSKRASALAPTQKVAISTAKRMSKSDNSRIVVHNSQGKIKRII